MYLQPLTVFTYIPTETSAGIFLHNHLKSVQRMVQKSKQTIENKDPDKERIFGEFSRPELRGEWLDCFRLKGRQQ